LAVIFGSNAGAIFILERNYSRLFEENFWRKLGKKTFRAFFGQNFYVNFEQPESDIFFEQNI
jgi:hypothetical protein